MESLSRCSFGQDLRAKIAEEECCLREYKWVVVLGPTPSSPLYIQVHTRRRHRPGGTRVGVCQTFRVLLMASPPHGPSRLCVPVPGPTSTISAQCILGCRCVPPPAIGNLRSLATTPIWKPLQPPFVLVRLEAVNPNPIATAAHPTREMKNETRSNPGAARPRNSKKGGR